MTTGRINQVAIFKTKETLTRQSPANAIPQLHPKSKQQRLAKHKPHLFTNKAQPFLATKTRNGNTKVIPIDLTLLHFHSLNLRSQPKQTPTQSHPKRCKTETLSQIRASFQIPCVKLHLLPFSTN